MIFAAKEAVEKRDMERGRRVGIQEGRQEERERIEQILERHGVELPPEVAEMIARESGPRP